MSEEQGNPGTNPRPNQQPNPPRTPAPKPSREQQRARQDKVPEESIPNATHHPYDPQSGEDVDPATLEPLAKQEEQIPPRVQPLMDVKVDHTAVRQAKTAVFPKQFQEPAEQLRAVGFGTLEIMSLILAFGPKLQELIGQLTKLRPSQTGAPPADSVHDSDVHVAVGRAVRNAYPDR